MPSMTIRGLSDEARDELAARAARRGQSMQEYVRLLLEREVAHADLDELLDGLARRKTAAGSRVATDDILAAREAERR
ncbi:MAG: hypothetical protein CMH83_07800 [Nocardioides sp.]|nr:hypothetical protein [Nocardioides sp.]